MSLGIFHSLTFSLCSQNTVPSDDRKHPFNKHHVKMSHFFSSLDSDVLKQLEPATLHLSKQSCFPCRYVAGSTRRTRRGPSPHHGFSHLSL